MDLLIDVHNHTIVSGHAYSTIQEIAAEASRKGLKMIGITDHGPAMPGAFSSSFIGNLSILPDFIYGVEVLRGVEANILDQSGKLDVPERRLKRLDVIIAGLHDACVRPWDTKGNTLALINAMENKYVDIIAHPGNPAFQIDKEAVVLKARETNTLIEINNGSFYSKSRFGSKDNCYEIARLCKKHEVSIIVGSDSHFSFEVGRFDRAIKLLEDVQMPEELIINTSADKLKKYLIEKGKKRYIKSDNNN